MKKEIARLTEDKEKVGIEKCANLEENVEAKGESNMLVCALGNHSKKCEVYLWKMRFCGINFSDLREFLPNSSK